MFQNKIDAEQRERQAKTDKEDREREYQLRREELAMQREDNRAQRNMMNIMMMTMFGGHQGGHGKRESQPKTPVVDQENNNYHDDPGDDAAPGDNGPGNI